MESVEVGNNLHITIQRWGVHITSFCNYLYEITHSWKRGKTKVLHPKKVALVENMKKLQLIKHLITLAQL